MEFKSLNIIAFDPGISTGVSIFEQGDFINAYTFTERELEGYVRCINKGQVQLDYIIIEEFRLRQSKAAAQTNDPLYTPQLIGKLKEWFSKYTIVMQQPSVANGPRFFTKKKVKELGIKWQSEHEYDAIVHGLYALVFNKEIK